MQRSGLHRASVLRRQAGTSLLEVLISMLLLSIGLLAMAGLSASAASYTKLSQIRGTAALLVADYAERARTNRLGFDSGAYAITNGYAFTKTTLAETGCNNPLTAACTDIQMAQFDQTQWLNLLITRLPGGDAYVLTTVNLPMQQRDMDIWIMWTEKELDTGLNLSQTNAAGNLACPTGAAVTPDVRCMYFKVSL